MICGSQRLSSHPILTLSTLDSILSYAHGKAAARPKGSGSPIPCAESRQANRRRLSAYLSRHILGGGGNRSGDESMLNPSRRIAVVQMYKYSHIITYKGQVIHRFSGRSKPHIHWIIPKFGQHSSARELEAMTDGRHSLDGRIAVNLPFVILHTPER